MAQSTTKKKPSPQPTQEQIAAHLQKIEQNKQWSGYSYDELRKELAITSAKLQLETSSMSNNFRQDVVHPFQRNRLTLKRLLNVVVIANIAWNGFKLYRKTKKMFGTQE